MIHQPQPWPIMAMDRIGPQSEFIRARKAEVSYARQLRRLASHIGDLIQGIWDPSDPLTSEQIGRILDQYAVTIKPWASSVGKRMITEVAARDRRAWMLTAAKMGRLLQREIDEAPTGRVMQAKLAEQVSLITSLPTEAAQRVHKLTLQGLTTGRRAADIAKEIARSGDVSKSRATLIARTEVGRTSTALTEARATAIGSTHFIWRTAGDSDVRPSHRRLNGKTFAWADPPECDPGHHALPGSIWNCRCYAEPVIPELY